MSVLQGIFNLYEVEMKTAIVTGASGFIGRNLITKLIKENVIIYALDKPEFAGKVSESDNVRFIPMSLDDTEALVEPLREVKADTLYHLAWSGVSTSNKNDYSMQLKNIEYTLNVMELAQQIGCGRVICPGSVSEYAYCGEPVNGNNKPTPGDMYAACKAATQIIAQLYAEQHGIDLIWLLIASVYGPGRDDANIITYSIKELLAGNKPSYTKLEQIWDYIYIDDLMNSIYLVGECGKPGSTYAIGSGQARPLSEYIMVIRDMIDPDLALGIGDMPYKTKRIDHSIVDISLLNEHTGFKPQVSFEEGIQRLIHYYKKGTV